MSLFMFTGSRLQQVRLLRASGYNKLVFFQTSDCHQCLESSDIRCTAHNEQILMTEVARSKWDPV